MNYFDCMICTLSRCILMYSYYGFYPAARTEWVFSLVFKLESTLYNSTYLRFQIQDREKNLVDSALSTWPVTEFVINTARTVNDYVKRVFICDVDFFLSKRRKNILFFSRLNIDTRAQELVWQGGQFTTYFLDKVIQNLILWPPTFGKIPTNFHCLPIIYYSEASYVTADK